MSDSCSSDRTPAPRPHRKGREVHLVVDTALAPVSDNDSSVWAVSDRDGDDVTVLAAEARRGGVGCAASTPTFETWLLLRLRDHRAAIVSGAQGEKLLRGLLPRWSRDNGARFHDFAHGLADACARARFSHRTPTRARGVHRLIKAVGRL